MNSIHPQNENSFKVNQVTLALITTPLRCEINKKNDVISDSIDNKSGDDFKPVQEKFSKYSSAAFAARFVSKHSLSTKKAAIVCKLLKEDGVDIASPTQVGV